RRRAEADRLQMERRLRQAQKMEAIGNLAGGIAHDFNNFLAVISATGELLEIDAAQHELGGRWLDGIHDIREAANRARDLVSQILLFSRNERAQREPVDLREVVLKSVSQVTNVLPAHVVVRHDFTTTRRAVANAS